MSVGDAHGAGVERPSTLHLVTGQGMRVCLALRDLGGAGVVTAVRHGHAGSGTDAGPVVDIARSALGRLIGRRVRGHYRGENVLHVRPWYVVYNAFSLKRGG